MIFYVGLLLMIFLISFSFIISPLSAILMVIGIELWHSRFFEMTPPTRPAFVRGRGGGGGGGRGIDLGLVDLDLDLDLHVVDRADMVLDFFELPVVQPVVQQEATVNDVHDHRIQSSLVESIRKLMAWYDKQTVKLPQDRVYSDIKKCIFSGGGDPTAPNSLDSLEKAYSTLQYIQKAKGKLLSVNRTESEILQMVWQRICDPVNSSVKAELVSNLVEMLADSAIQVGTPYCLVGRVTRMVQALQHIDKEGLIRINKTDLIAKEIQSKIPLIVDMFFTENPNLLDSYNAGEKEVAGRLMEFTRDRVYADLPPDAQKNPEIKTIIDEHINALD